MSVNATNTRIHLSPPHLAGDELDRLKSVIDSNWIAPCGPELERFEHAMAKRLGVAHALAVSSGTAALHLAIRHLRLQPGDEVLCSTLTFCASANPIVYEGGQPVFVDSEKSTWNLDLNLVEEELTAATRRGRLPRAVIAVDIFGQPVDMDALVAIAGRYGVPVIEDAAEALGSRLNDQPVGGQGWCSILSFNGNKIITTSGGGMLCSNDSELITASRHLATQARDPAPHYQHSQIGFNYRLSNLLAAVGLAQLDVLDERVQARRRNFERYQAALQDIPGISFMPEAMHAQSNRWLTVVLIDQDNFGSSRDDLRDLLEASNIESRPVWKPLHMQPVFAGCRCLNGHVAEQLFATGLCLPSGSSLSQEEIDRVIGAIRSAARPARLPAINAA